MKTKILGCIEELVKSRFGKEKWQECRDKADELKGTITRCLPGVTDEDMLAVMVAAEEVIGLEMGQLMGAFAEYWGSTYAPRLYRQYFEHAKVAHDSIFSPKHVRPRPASH